MPKPASRRAQIPAQQQTPRRIHPKLRASQPAPAGSRGQAPPAIVQVDTYFGHRRNFGDGLLRSDGRGSGGIPFVEIRKPYRFIQFFELVQNQIPLDAGDIVRTRPAIDQFDQTGKFFLYLVHLHNKIGLSEPKVRKISDAGNGLSADCQKFTDAARRLFSESEKLCISLLRMQNRTKNLRTDTAPALLHIPTLKKSS